MAADPYTRTVKAWFAWNVPDGPFYETPEDARANPPADLPCLVCHGAKQVRDGTTTIDCPRCHGTGIDPEHYDVRLLMQYRFADGSEELIGRSMEVPDAPAA